MIEFLLPLIDDQPAVVERPAIIDKPIPYPAKRKRQMAGYAQRHYGTGTWRLDSPKVVVLHFTTTSSWTSPFYHFSNNNPAPGPAGTRAESPGPCTHFLVHTDGRIFQLVDLDVMCRHAIGINDEAIGIEFIEPRSAANVLARSKQRRAGVRLVRWLQYRFGIATSDVIGHSEVNDSPHYTEKARGWRNDHTDWSPAQSRQFRRLL